MFLTVECHAPEKMDMVRPPLDTYGEHEWDVPDSAPTEVVEGGLTQFCTIPFEGRLSFWGQAPKLLTEECHASKRMDKVRPPSDTYGEQEWDLPDSAFTEVLEGWADTILRIPF